MLAQLQTQTITRQQPSFTQVRTGTLQRRCACGGSPGVDGECQECRSKRLSSQQHIAPMVLQAKLTVNKPGDRYEQEANQVAEQIMRMPATKAEDKHDKNTLAVNETEERAALHREVAPSTSKSLYNACVPDVVGSPGQPLDASTKTFMEPRFQHDFSKVRIHTDARAAESARSVNAVAYTMGRNIVFGAGQYAPHTSEGKRLIAHELTHVVQQGRLQSSIVKNNNAVPMIQRRLMTFGTPTDINALLGLLGSPAGLVLNSNISNNQVQIVSELPITPSSPSLRAELKRIINHPTQYAELVVARGQSHVLVGAFPPPEDLNIAKVQKIDIDDILAIEAKTPGSGVAVAAHEIEENFQLHKTPKATTVPASKRRTAQAHEQAIKSESAIAEELVGPGQRVAHDLVTTGPGTKVFAIDYSNYYLVVTINASADVLDSRRTKKIVVSSRTISNFTFNSDDVPAPDVAAALATIANVADDVMMNKPSTVLIEGFTDNVGSADVNLLLSKRRAERVKRTLVSALVDRGKNASTAWKQIQIEGRGKTNFVAPNDTPLHRAQNRRVVITVMRPDL